MGQQFGNLMNTNDKTSNEQAYFDRVRQHMTSLHAFLNEHQLPEENDPIAWFKFVARIREIQGNINNDQSFLATYLAKEYLMHRFASVVYDSAEKAQGAPGLDIDIELPDNRRIIGEIKTTVAYEKTDLGSAQRTSFRKDFTKLNAETAQFKFFFLTDRRTYDIVQERYVHEIPGVEVVLLIND
jgi:hypothetical protein